MSSSDMEYESFNPVTNSVSVLKIVLRGCCFFSQSEKSFKLIFYVYALWMKLTCIFQMQTKRSSNVESENSLTSFENHQFDETKSGFDLLPYANSVYEKRLAQIKRGSGEGGDFIRCFFLLIHRFRQSR